MPEIEDPEDPEIYWLASRVKIVESRYFETEAEAREFAGKHGGFTVEPPVQKIIRRGDAE